MIGGNNENRSFCMSDMQNECYTGRFVGTVSQIPHKCLYETL